MDIMPFKFIMRHITQKMSLMGDALSGAPNTPPKRWVSDPSTPDMDVVFYRRVFTRQVLATDQ